MPLPFRPALLLFAGALAAAFWRSPPPPPAGFASLPAATASALPAQFVAEPLPSEADSASHPALAELPDGRIAAAWLAGSGQEMTIRYSLRERDGWRLPATIASRESTAGGSFAYVDRLGPPVLHAEGSWLHLWYGSATLGPTINHSVSTDTGRNWAKPSRLETSPFANVGSAVSAAPVPLAHGGLGLPATHDFMGRHGQWLQLAPTGRMVDVRRLPGNGTQQAAVVALDARRGIAVLRASDGISLATTEDGGEHWQAGAPLTGPNPKASLALLRLKSGRLLLAGTPAAGSQTMHLWLSADDGRHWQASRSIDTARDGTNPALLLGRDGHIHLAYDVHGPRIQHVVFSEAWLDGGQP